MGQEWVCKWAEEKNGDRELLDQPSEYYLAAAWGQGRVCSLSPVDQWKELLVSRLTFGHPMAVISTELRAVHSGEQQGS